MIVKFASTFHVPGFGRKRFPRGTVYDVPESLRNRLPKTAVILDNDYSEEEDQAVKDERLAADYARATAESTDHEKLVQAGLAGYEDKEPEAEPKEVAEKKPAKAPRRTAKK